MQGFFYRIDGLVPGKGDLSSCGFSVQIHEGYALEALETKMKECDREKLVEEGLEIKKRLRLKGMQGEHPYTFAKDSWLLQWCQVPGDATDLGLDSNRLTDLTDFLSVEYRQTHQQEYELWKKEEGYLLYVPHNVDTPLQAYGLLSLWTHWANKLRIVLLEKVKHGTLQTTM